MADHKKADQCQSMRQRRAAVARRQKGLFITMREVQGVSGWGSLIGSYRDPMRMFDHGAPTRASSRVFSKWEETEGRVENNEALSAAQSAIRSANGICTSGSHC